jgi:hypothetical protein
VIDGLVAKPPTLASLRPNWTDKPASSGVGLAFGCRLPGWGWPSGGAAFAFSFTICATGPPVCGLHGGLPAVRVQPVGTGLLNAPDRATLIGLRNRAMLALLVGCGLRRAELVSLEVEHIQLRDSRWVIPDLAGKGNRLRTVPCRPGSRVIVDEWLECAGVAAGPSCGL